MTVTAGARSASYLIAAGVTGYAVPFDLIQAADLLVYRHDPGAFDPTDPGDLLTEGVHYTVSSNLGAIAPTPAFPAGGTLTLYRVTSRAQTAEYTPNDGFPATAHETQLDRLSLVDQEHDDNLGALSAVALRLPAGETVTALPAASERAGKVLGFDPVTGEPTAQTYSGAPLGSLDDPSDFEAPSSADVLDALAGKSDRVPSNAYTLLTNGYAEVYPAVLNRFTESGAILHTNGGGINVGLVERANPQPSMWQMWSLMNNIQHEWQLATDVGDATRVAAAVSLATTNWTHVKAVVSAGDLTFGTNGVVNISDDAAWHAKGLAQLGKMGIDKTNVINWLMEFIPYNTNRFHDPYQTGADYIDYGVSSPGGIAFKSDRWGILYGAYTDTVSIHLYGYISTVYEAILADAALWLSTQSQVPTAYRAALQTYAVNVYNHLFAHMRTPAPADATRVGQGVYFCDFNLDPNVDAQHDTSFNGGAAITGSYNPGQQFHHPRNEFFGRPGRSANQCAQYDNGTVAVGALAGHLFQVVGAQACATEAVSISNAFAQPNTFGRALAGIPVLGNLRDPYTNGHDWPDFVKYAKDLPGFDATGLLRRSLINTARWLITSNNAGYLHANWNGREWNPTEKSYLWEETGILQNGGQAAPKQIMTTATSLSMIQAAQPFASQEVGLGSGIDPQAAIEMLPSMYAMTRVLAETRQPRGSTIVNGSVAVHQYATRIDVNEANEGYLNLADGTYIKYGARTAIDIFLGTARKMAIEATVANFDVRIARAAQLYLDYVYGFPAINFANGAYILYNTTKNRFEFGAGGMTAATLDGSGNLRLRGTSTPSLGAGIDS